MTTSVNLTTDDGLRAYLEASGGSPVSVTLLTGGTANYVYRVALQDGTSRIYKHAAPYLHSNKSFEFDPIRMDYENLALEIIPTTLQALSPNSAVHAVKRFSYDQSNKLLCIEDGGNRNLKAAYEDQQIDIPAVGADLANWIATLHISSSETSLSLANEGKMENNPIAVNIYRHSYVNLHTAFAKFGHDLKLAEAVNDEFGSKLATDNESLCHGDFWPGNVLVKFNDNSAVGADLTVVDFEMVRRGHNATDVGQFAAEAFLMDRFRGQRGLLESFLKSYIETRERNSNKVGKSWLKRMIIHFGVHIAFWPTRVPHTDEEGTRELVSIGVSILEAAIAEDWVAIRKFDLFKGDGELWNTIVER